MGKNVFENVTPGKLIKLYLTLIVMVILVILIYGIFGPALVSAKDTLQVWMGFGLLLVGGPVLGFLIDKTVRQIKALS